MASLLFTLQNSTPLASAPEQLDIINKFVVAFFLVGIGFLLLLTMNANRRNKMRALAGKPVPGKEKKRIHGDLVSRLPHMTREELRLMVLSDQAKKQTCESPQSTESSNSMQPPDMEVTTSPATTMVKDATPVVVSAPETKPSASAIPPDIELIGKILIDKPKTSDEAASKSSDEPEPKPVDETVPKSRQSPYQGKVERSALSNEIPEEFKRKSRKI
jgi:hypothetical protein